MIEGTLEAFDAKQQQQQQQLQKTTNVTTSRKSRVSRKRRAPVNTRNHEDAVLWQCGNNASVSQIVPLRIYRVLLSNAYIRRLVNDTVDDDSDDCHD